MKIETSIMPPQFDHPWDSTSPLGLPGADDDSLDLNIFDDLSFLDDSPLFPDALLDVCAGDMMEDFLVSSQVRHDCMWAGTCVDDNKERPNPQSRLQQESPVKCGSLPALTPCHETPTKDADSVPALMTSVTPSSRAKCNQRSILRTNLNLASAVNTVSSDPLRTASQDESDDSGRPDTPLSMEGSEPDTEFKHDYELASSCIGDEEEEEEDVDDDVEEEEDEDEDEDDEETEEEDEEDTNSPMVNAAEATGQTVRTPSHHTSRFDSRPQQMSNHFFNDHSYHLSKDVHPSIPGNLTPSDSEDEIDVVSVCGEKSSSSRSSSQSALPSNPSARDRHALQQTMASAMKRSAYSASPTTYPSYLSGRQPSGKLARMQAERQRQRERKRRAQERDDSSEEDVVRPTKKRAKHHHAYKPARRGAASHNFSKASSSDSEPDSCEKRSLHNNMERQRRVDLRNAFEDLRVVVPELSNNARAAKVVILKEASHFCRQLTYDSKSLQQESVALERERERLLARVSFLRKQVACMRMGREA